MSRHLPSVAILAVLVLVSTLAGLGSVRPGHTRAAKALSDPVPLNTDPQWNRTQPHVAYDSRNDRYLFVWRDKRNDAPDNRWDERCDYRQTDPEYCWPNADIYGRLMDGQGNLIGDEDILIAGDSADGPRDQQWPHIVYNATRNEYLVAWQEVSALAVPGGDAANWFRYCYDIKAQRIGSDAEFLGEVIVVSEAEDCQWVPAVSYDSLQDKYLLTWHDHRHRQWDPEESTSDKEIYARWLEYDDGLLTPSGDGDFLITTDVLSPTLAAPQYQEYSDVSFNRHTGDHLVVWSDDRLSATHDGEYDIFFQRLENGANVSMANQPLHVQPNVQEKPRASYNDRTQETWVIWQSYEARDAGETSRFEVQMARLDAQGSIVEDQVVTVVSDVAGFPRPAYLLPDVACSVPSGNCLAIWHLGGPTYGHFDQDALPVAWPVQLHETSAWATYPRVVAGNGPRGAEFMATFSDGGSIYRVQIEDIAVPPTLTPTPTATRTLTSTPTLTSSPTASATPADEPDLSGSEKLACPTVIQPGQEVTFFITVRNGGDGVADVSLTDQPPLPYQAGSAAGGITWDDTSGTLRWQGRLEPGESRVLFYSVHGPTPPVPPDTVYENLATVDDGVHSPFTLSASVVVNPRPTVTHTPSATPSPTSTASATNPTTATATATASATNTATATATAPVSLHRLYLPVIIRGA